MSYQPDQVPQNVLEKEVEKYIPITKPKTEFAQDVYTRFDAQDWDEAKEEMDNAEDNFDLLTKVFVLKKFDAGRFDAEVNVQKNKLLELAKEVKFLIAGKNLGHFLYFANMLKTISPIVFEDQVASQLTEDNWSRLASHVQSRIKKPDSISDSVDLISEFQFVAPADRQIKPDEVVSLQVEVAQLKGSGSALDFSQIEFLKTINKFQRLFPSLAIKISKDDLREGIEKLDLFIKLNDDKQPLEIMRLAGGLLELEAD